ncbi:MAG: aminopeptidase P family protein [Acidimicrobiia bacterium]
MDHAARRRRLLDALDTTDGVVLLLGHRDAARDHAADQYPFHQDASFRYFVGLDEPDAAVVIDPDTGDTTLFGTEPDLDDVLWHGPRPPLAERAQAADADHHRPLADLTDAVAGRSVLTLPSTRETQAADLRRLLGPDHRPSEALIAAVVALREVKEPEEVAEVERAVAATATIHAAAMAAVAEGRPEADVVAELEALLAAHRLEWAYSPIFTVRGEVLHRLEHTDLMARRDLLLFDGAVRSERGYAADITRTLPVSGRFEGRGRDLYEVVLAAQTRALELLAPGVRHLDVHRSVGRVVLEGFASLGLCRGDLDAAAEADAYGVVFPHGLGHLLGLETHDMEGLGEDRVGYDAETTRPETFGPSNLRIGKRLRTGMVLTVEPGAYLIGPLIERFAAEGRFTGFWDYDALADWVGIGGVRIEDVALVTPDGVRVLGPPIPKSIDAVEAAMAG